MARPTDAFTFHREVVSNNGRLEMITLEARSLPPVPVFDDSDSDAHYGKVNPMGSVKVAATGTTITVVDRTDGVMTIEVD